MKNKRNILKKFMLLIIGTILITACTNKQTTNDAAKDTSNKELTSITVSEPVRSELWGPVYLAKTLGYFEEEGLDVNFVTTQSDMPTAPVLSGDAQFGLYGPEMIMRFNAEGQDTKLLLSVSDRFPYSFVTSPDIKDTSQLKGTVINGADSGSSPRAFVRTILSQAGLNPDTDATYVNIVGASSIAALESGEISATFVSPTARKPALDAGANLLIDIYDNATHKEVLGSDSYEMYIAFTTDEYIKNNRETVQAFTNAVYKAIRWADTHSTEEIIDGMKPLFEHSQTLTDAIKEIKENDLWSGTGTFSEDGFNAITGIAKESGLIEESPTRESVLAEEFINNANEQIKE